jgi:hypothetical protein
MIDYYLVTLAQTTSRRRRKVSVTVGFGVVLPSIQAYVFNFGTPPVPFPTFP